MKIQLDISWTYWCRSCLNWSNIRLHSPYSRCSFDHSLACHRWSYSCRSHSNICLIGCSTRPSYRNLSSHCTFLILFQFLVPRSPLISFSLKWNPRKEMKYNNFRILKISHFSGFTYFPNTTLALSECLTGLPTFGFLSL